MNYDRKVLIRKYAQWSQSFDKKIWTLRAGAVDIADKETCWDRLVSSSQRIQYMWFYYSCAAGVPKKVGKHNFEGDLFVYLKIWFLDLLGPFEPLWPKIWSANIALKSLSTFFLGHPVVC